MQSLFDIHCHFVPGVDDGADSMEESLWLLGREYEDGVRSIILTPHFRYQMFETPMEMVQERFDALCEAAEEKFGDGLRLYLGCELHASEDMAEKLQARERLTMAGSRYVLVEFSHSDNKSYIMNHVQNLCMNGYIPIIAHVERYAATRKDMDFLWDLKKAGALIQMNADGINGREGFAGKSFAKKVMREDLLDFIGSDAHNRTDRFPEMGKCFKQVSKLMGEDYARHIFIDNPAEIILSLED